MTEAMEEHPCGCSEEFGPCEQHGVVQVQREGAAVRTAEELQIQFLDDALALAPDALAPYGQDVLSEAREAWNADRELDFNLSEELDSVVNQVETELGVAGYSTYREDGYVIVQVTGGPLAEED